MWKNQISIKILKFLLQYSDYDIRTFSVLQSKDMHDVFGNVIQFCRTHDTPCFTSDKHQSFHKILAFNPNIIISVQYPYIFSKDFLSKYNNTIINIHYSFLPYYRGVACITHAILNGETTHGVTIHKINAGIDTGNIIDQTRFDIQYMTNKQVYILCEDRAFYLFKKNWKAIESNTFQSYPMNINQGNYYQKKHLNYQTNHAQKHWSTQQLLQFALAYTFPPISFAYDAHGRKFTHDKLEKLIDYVKHK